MVKGNTAKGHRIRLATVSLFLFLLFCLLIYQFFKVQIVEGEKWTKYANSQHQFILVEPFKRGVFYSNVAIKEGHPTDPQPLVLDIPQFHLYIDPLSIPDAIKGKITGQIASFLKISDEKNLRLQFDKPLRSRRIAKWLNLEAKEKIVKWWDSFAKKNKIPKNALFFLKDYRRSYPFGKLLGQVLHTIREDRDEKTAQNIPTGGLELFFDSFLQGKPGKRLFFRSPRHALDVGKVSLDPENGADVYLTINHYLQAIAEEEIEKAVKKAGAQAGWAIMMHPRSGEIYALAQYPFFHPASYAEFYNDEKKLNDTKVKAVTDAFEPGSTMKPITLAICLLANEELKKRGKPPLFSPQEKVATSPSLFPGRSKPIRDMRYHKFLNMQMAIQKSSNVYVAKMVQRVIDRLGVDWYRSQLQNVFGFGQKTEIELPSESPGLLPLPGKVYPNGTMEWSTPTPFSLAMGHNILVNSMQMVRNFAIIVNGGYEVKPTIVKKIVKTHCDGSQTVVLDNSNMQSLKKVIDSSIAAQIVNGMKFTTKPGGSAQYAEVYGYSEGGKTSTSEKIINGKYSKKHHISTFIGFAPASDPTFVLMVVIDEPEYKYIPGMGGNQYGGVCAAPAFGEIAKRALQYLGVTPDDPFGYPKTDPRANSNKADWNEEVQNLKNLYNAWNK
ncbi:MAG: penicillin-binding protein 2 [Chlamydiae bacterium]|nr:penicillin-binding protein 2 [Chlamydiota bacterium]